MLWVLGLRVLGFWVLGLGFRVLGFGLSEALLDHPLFQEANSLADVAMPFSPLCSCSALLLCASRVKEGCYKGSLKGIYRGLEFSV